jgi:hypothetical protein
MRQWRHLKVLLVDVADVLTEGGEASRSVGQGMIWWPSIYCGMVEASCVAYGRSEEMKPSLACSVLDLPGRVGGPRVCARDTPPLQTHCA